MATKKAAPKKKGRLLRIQTPATRKTEIIVLSSATPEGLAKKVNALLAQSETFWRCCYGRRDNTSEKKSGTEYEILYEVAFSAPSNVYAMALRKTEWSRK